MNVFPSNGEPPLAAPPEGSLVSSRKPKVPSKVACILAAALPSHLKAAVYRGWGWEIGKDVRLGFSIIHAARVTIGDGVAIGHGNIFKNIRVLTIEQGALVKHLNHFFAQPDAMEGARELRVDHGAHIMSRHFFDLAGRIHIGPHAVIGGRETQIWTHSIRMTAEGRRTVSSEVVIGAGAYVGARATLVECTISQHSVVAAATVVAGSVGRDQREGLLYRGNPATVTLLNNYGPTDL